MNTLNKTRIVASKDKDVKISTYSCHHSGTHLFPRNLSVHSNHSNKLIEHDRTHQEGAGFGPRRLESLGPSTLVDHVWFRVQSLAVRPRVAEHDEAENGRKSYSHSQAACSDQHQIPDTEVGVLISASNRLQKSNRGKIYGGITWNHMESPRPFGPSSLGILARTRRLSSLSKTALSQWKWMTMSP